ncbi:MAG: hypothetical protein L0331_12340, partial [Chloroflexi bacterium]|nr:hypothetical protein [Chloroflexota bacterium]
LWQDGQYTGRPLSKPPTNGEIIVDNEPSNTGSFIKGRGDPFNITCPSTSSCTDWYYITGSGTGYASDTHYTPVKVNSSDDYWAKWIPSGIPEGGSMYQVFVYSPSNAYATSWQAPYTVVHSSGETTGRIAQGSLPNPSWSNSYWVSIGTYHLEPGDYVYTTSATGETQGSRQVGVDAVKFARLGSTYSPHVQVSPSTVTFHSNNGTAHVIVREYSSSGVYLGRHMTYVPAHTSHQINPFNANTRSVVIDATQDISVITELFYGTAPAAYNGLTLPNGMGSAGWEKAGSTLYTPLVKYNHYGRWSKIFVVNAGSQSTTLSVTFYDQAGNTYNGGSFPNFTPNKQIALTPPSNTTLYAAVLSSNNNQPLAAMVLEGDTISATSKPGAYNAVSTGSYVLYAPKVKKNYFEHTTGITLQNLSGTTANVTATYCDTTGYCDPAYTFNVQIPAHAPYPIVNPSAIGDGFLGSAKFTSDQPIVGQMTESNITFMGDRRMMDNLLLSGSNTIFLSRWYDSYAIPGIGGNWISGVTIRNVGTGSATITAYYYDDSGFLAYTESATLSNVNDVHVFTNNSLNNFKGAVTIISTQPIVAIENSRDYNGSGDTTMSANGSNR